MPNCAEFDGISIKPFSHQLVKLCFSLAVSDDQLNREASSRAGSRMSGRSLSRRSGRSSALDYADLGQNEAQGLETGPQSSAADDEEHDMDEQFFEFSKETGKEIFFFEGGGGGVFVCLFFQEFGQKAMNTLTHIAPC